MVGKSMRASSQIAGISLTSAQKLEKGDRDQRRGTNPSGVRSHYVYRNVEPIPYEKLGPEAQRAWNDFPYFQRRYFGRVPLPWQEEAALKVVEWLLSDEEEYAVINAPPGVGKTLLFTHDIPAWLIVRNRGIRILLGAVTGNLAGNYVARLRTTMELTKPMQAKPQELATGAAFDAESTLASDFGRFKPLERDLWTRDAFVVAQMDNSRVTEKEPTVQGFGFDSEFIGNRVDFSNWDDLVNPRRQRSVLSREQLRNDYDTLAETRLEPRGVHLLTGQRLAGDDLYRYCLDKRIPELVDDETGDILEEVPKYHHLCFPAHLEDERCHAENHKKDAPSYPEGCLLAPKRLSWRKLSGIKHDTPDLYEVVYQQKDTNPTSVLVPRDWVNGVGDYPGCLDMDRDRLELPEGLIPPLHSILTVDPSGVQYWAIQWWIYQPATEQRFLMDLLKKPLKANEFLEQNPGNGDYSGVLEEWWQTSKALGWPITHVVVEINAAQRYLVAYKFSRDWFTKRGVQLIQHTTHKNKTDPDKGVWTTRESWRMGRIRLPYKDHHLGRLESSKLIDEVTTYPTGQTTDQVMAMWFMELQIPKLFPPDTGPSYDWRPGFVHRQRGYLG